MTKQLISLRRLRTVGCRLARHGFPGQRRPRRGAGINERGPGAKTVRLAAVEVGEVSFKPGRVPTSTQRSTPPALRAAGRAALENRKYKDAIIFCDA